MKDLYLCKTCRTILNTVDYHCGLCFEPICKKCAVFTVETFDYLRRVPEKLTHPCTCSLCYDQEIAKPTEEYLERVEQSKEIIIFSKNESKQTRLFSRKEPAYVVEDCDDEEDALRHMSFWAIEDNFNCLIDITYAKKKIVIGSHKKFIWTGRGIPVNIDTKRLR